MNYKNRKRAYYQENSCMDNFICKNCGCLVVPEGAGTQHRNHCPHCLHSLHVDIIPGDRLADCDANMEPIGVWVRKMVSGQLFIVVHAVDILVLIVLRLMIIQ